MQGIIRRSRGRLATLIGNLGVSAVALVAVFAMLEFGVFRYLLVPDDVLPNVSINHVVRYLPGTTAVFRHPDGSTSTVTINADGWNSTKPHYVLDPPEDRIRIAVVGDSYVQASYIDTADAFPEVLERTLDKRGIKAEVLRFGMDGAPLSQYLWMLRREVLSYRPDVVVIPLIHNDFDESYRFIGTRYNSSFMKIGTNDAGETVELAPQDFQPGAADYLRELSTFRYLYYETNAYLKLKGLVTRYVWGKEQDYDPEFISSAIDIRNITEHNKIRWAVRYILREMKQLSQEHGFLLAFVMDGVREAIYAGKDRAEYPVSALNDIAAELTAEAGLPFLDLQAAFAKEYAATGKRLEFPWDWHWNARANEVVGETIATMLIEDARLLPKGTRRLSALGEPKAVAQ